MKSKHNKKSLNWDRVEALERANRHILQSLEWLVKASEDYMIDQSEGNEANLRQAINESK